MKIKINTRQLHKALTVLLKGVPAKAMVPILENFLLEARNGKLCITSFDNEVAITALIDAQEVTGDDSFALPAKIFTQLVSAMPDDDMELIRHGDDAFVTCDWGSGKSTMPVFEGIDFPKPKKLKTEIDSVIFPQSFLKDALTRSIHATADISEARTMLSGVLFEMRPDGTNIVASDTHIMICTESPVGGNARIVLPQKTAAILKSLLERNNDVEVKTDGTTAEFKVGGFTVTSQLIQQQYPKWKNVLPTDNSKVLTVNRKKIAEAVKRVMVCTNAVSKLLKVSLSYNEIKIEGQDLGYNINAHETMTCDYDGEDLEIGFKAPSLLFLLENIVSNDVEISFKTAKNAVLINPVCDQYKDEPVKSIIMPMVVS